MTQGEQITKASGSNLALAFIAMPPEKRRDISTFYAFCRVVDDLADEPGMPVEERRAQLERWREALAGPVPGEHALAADFRAVLAKYGIDPTLAGEIITGMEMDLEARRYETLADLQLYCYRVAGVVGLVSIQIFGCHSQAACEHARALGEALQLTNILRDVGEDYGHEQRIYLPLAEMARHGYREADLAAGTRNGPFFSLMQSLADLALEDYATAWRLVTPEDRRNLLPGLIMGDIYLGVLRKMRRDQFRIFEKRYRLSHIEKLVAIVARTLRTRFWQPTPPPNTKL